MVGPEEGIVVTKDPRFAAPKSYTRAELAKLGDNVAEIVAEQTGTADGDVDATTVERALRNESVEAHGLGDLLASRVIGSDPLEITDDELSDRGQEYGAKMEVGAVLDKAADEVTPDDFRRAEELQLEVLADGMYGKPLDELDSIERARVASALRNAKFEAQVEAARLAEAVGNVGAGSGDGTGSGDGSGGGSGSSGTGSGADTGTGGAAGAGGADGAAGAGGGMAEAIAGRVAGGVTGGLAGAGSGAGGGSGGTGTGGGEGSGTGSGSGATAGAGAAAGAAAGQADTGSSGSSLAGAGAVAGAGLGGAVGTGNGSGSGDSGSGDTASGDTGTSGTPSQDAPSQDAPSQDAPSQGTTTQTSPTTNTAPPADADTSSQDYGQGQSMAAYDEHGFVGSEAAPEDLDHGQPSHWLMDWGGSEVTWVNMSTGATAVYDAESGLWVDSSTGAPVDAINNAQGSGSGAGTGAGADSSSSESAATTTESSSSETTASDDSGSDDDGDGDDNDDDDDGGDTETTTTESATSGDDGTTEEGDGEPGGTEGTPTPDGDYRYTGPGWLAHDDTRVGRNEVQNQKRGIDANRPGAGVTDPVDEGSGSSGGGPVRFIGGAADPHRFEERASGLSDIDELRLPGAGVTDPPESGSPSGGSSGSGGVGPIVGGGLRGSSNLAFGTGATGSRADSPLAGTTDGDELGGEDVDAATADPTTADPGAHLSSLVVDDGLDQLGVELGGPLIDLGRNLSVDLDADALGDIVDD